MSESARMGSSYIGTEHLLLGLMREDEGMAHTVLTEAGLADDLLTEMVRKSVGAGLPGGNPAQGLTPRAKHVVEIAMEDSIRGGYAYIGTEHLLMGLLREGSNMAVRILSVIYLAASAVIALGYRGAAAQRLCGSAAGYHGLRQQQRHDAFHRPAVHHPDRLGHDTGLRH